MTGGMSYGNAGNKRKVYDGFLIKPVPDCIDRVTNMQVTTG